MPSNNHLQQQTRHGLTATCHDHVTGIRRPNGAEQRQMSFTAYHETKWDGGRPVFPFEFKKRTYIGLLISRPRMLDVAHSYINTHKNVCIYYVYSSIHVARLYHITPLQENVSEALPTPARLKRN